MGGEENPDEDDELLIALQHRLRRRLLKTIVERHRGGEVSSPRGLADELDESLRDVSYHVRVLAERGAVVLVNTEPVKGSIQHFYSPTIDEPWVFAVLGLDENGEPIERDDEDPPGPGPTS